MLILSSLEVYMAHFTKKQMLCVFLSGAAAGAAAAILYAPKSGAQTRRDIRRFSKRAADQLDCLQEDFKAQVSDGYEQVMEMLDNVKEYVEDGKTKLQKMIQTA